jgi:hypothetical protein
VKNKQKEKSKIDFWDSTRGKISSKSLIIMKFRFALYLYEIKSYEFQFYNPHPIVRKVRKPQVDRRPDQRQMKTNSSLQRRQ